MYIKRSIEKVISDSLKSYPVLMVCGPRQVGKTTLLNNLANKKYNYVTLDDPNERLNAKLDPELFLEKHGMPLFIDEIQYATELLPYIKMIVDKKNLENNKNANGLFILTGSQMFRMMKDVSESLAGRVMILNLFGLSQNEIKEYPEGLFVPTYDYIKKRENNDRMNLNQLYEKIFRGSMPKLYIDKKMDPSAYYNGYVATYLERDIRDLINIKDETKFIKFISSIAARTGQEVIYEELSKSNDIDNKTAQSWLSLLVSSGIVYLLQPYYDSALRRIIKRPKMYFMDTGLACYLTKWSDAKTLESGTMDGSILETYVVSEIIKTYINNGKDPNQFLFYYRDDKGREIDLLIVKDNTIFPIEIKKSTNPSRDSIKNFKVLEKSKLNIGEGGVICLSKVTRPINENNNIIPIQCI